MLVLHLVVLEMGFAVRELHTPADSGGMSGIEIIQLYKDNETMEVDTEGAQNGSTLEAINGDAPCLKRAGLPCGGGGGPTMENINFG
ncbi:hypothetical protein DY000_02018888 [Brassica cretica]|uniref:Uncharacterized protein n=1 Tax=Brassica cretica TaxID=69181 RepID=A0ABQ7CWH1_BRACR|nr:hypothetical protein DY000_02018888 [Brassica cretica]